MDKKNITLHDLTPLGDGSYRTSNGRIVNTKISSSSTTIQVDVSGAHVSIRQSTRVTAEDYNRAINKVVISEKESSFKPVQWVIGQFKHLVSYFTHHFDEKKKKKELAQKTIAGLKAAEEKYNNLSIEEKITQKFNIFRKQVALLDAMSNDKIHKIYGSITKSLNSLQENSLSLSQYDDIVLNQEVNSLVFNVLPNIMDVYAKSIHLPHADILSLSGKLEQGLSTLAQKISSLKEQHITQEQTSSLQALDEAFQFAESRFVDVKDEANNMIQTSPTNQTKLVDQEHRRTLKM